MKKVVLKKRRIPIDAAKAAPVGRTRKSSAVGRARKGAKPVRLIHVLSDSTGNLGQHVVNALLTQFERGSFAVRLHNFLDHPARLEGALDDVVRAGGIVFHAVVSTPAKRMITRRCRLAGLPACDVTGGFMKFLCRHSDAPPLDDVTRLHDVDLDPRYQRRISAIEFTLQHDDGLGLNTINEADIVLTGVSRTSKTPTSIYLAQQGYKVCNVALAREVAPPVELLSFPPGKVVGLLIDPLRLVRIRTKRQNEWGMTDTSYNDEEKVREEVQWSRKLFAQRGWATIDVTNSAIEETAARVVAALGLGAHERE